MATSGSTITVPSADGKDWTLSVSLDIETGKLTYDINGSSGKLIYTGSFETVMASVDATISAPDVSQDTKDFFAVLKDRLTSENSTWLPQSQEIIDKLKITRPDATPPPDATKAPASGDGDQSGDGATGSTTVAGKAGKSKADELSKLGIRDYNPLSEFSSYTYRISLYMMNTKQFNEYMMGDYSTIKDFLLIVQSGGITAGVDSPRAPDFDLDLYIDDLEIVTETNTKETMTATNSVKFKFKIYEPYGFSFPHKLTQAMVASQKRNADLTNQTLEQIRSLNEGFLLVIKFYGYDKDGKLVSSTDYPQPGILKTDSQSVFERGFPITFDEFKFKLENKMTVYSITANQYAASVAKGTAYGTVPAKMSVSGETVKDVLFGKSQNSGKQSIVGLTDLLNKMEEEELKKKTISVKNEYAIEFMENTGIDDALLVPKDYYVKEKTPMATVAGGSANSNERTAWQKRLGTVEKKTRTIEIMAGQPIIQVIDNIISQSEYIKKMMVAVDQEIDELVKQSDAETVPNPKPATLSWYNINTVVEKKEWDDMRRSYAHKITYVIGKYEIPYIRTIYASNYLDYYGPHKRYDYWYTGKNKEILSYEQDYNFLFRVEGALTSDAETKNLQSAKTVLKSGISGVDATTTKSGKNDIVNSVKSFLYSDGDLAKFKIRILGDPDYLMPYIDTSPGGGENKWYGKDLSINPNAGQVFFEIAFQQAEDYNNETGLLTPNSDIQFARYPDTMRIKPKGIVYMLMRVTSTFSKGRFEQRLEGTIPEFVSGGSKSAETGRDTTPPPTTANPRQDKPAPEPSTKDTSANSTNASNTNKEVTQLPTLPPSGVASDDSPGTTRKTAIQQQNEKAAGRPVSGRGSSRG